MLLKRTAMYFQYFKTSYINELKWIKLNFNYYTQSEKAENELACPLNYYLLLNNLSTNKNIFIKSKYKDNAANTIPCISLLCACIRFIFCMSYAVNAPNTIIPKKHTPKLNVEETKNICIIVSKIKPITNIMAN